MSFVAPGPSTSVAEVTNVSRHGFWLLLGQEELFVPFSDFPWFAKAAVGELVNVEWHPRTISIGPFSMWTWRWIRSAIRSAFRWCRGALASGLRTDAVKALAHSHSWPYMAK